MSIWLAETHVYFSLALKKCVNYPDNTNITYYYDDYEKELVSLRSCTSLPRMHIYGEKNVFLTPLK